MIRQARLARLLAWTLTPVLVAGACAPNLPAGLGDLPVAQARVDGVQLRLAVAGDVRLGLSGLDGLGDLDGMLFDYGRHVAPAAHPFWMEGVRFPLDIAFFAEDGALVDRVRMEPCADGAGCPVHVAQAPFRFVVETPPGLLATADRLAIDAIGVP